MRPVARIAQSVEQGIENPRVLGSIPSPGTTYSENPAYGWVFAFLRPDSPSNSVRLFAAQRLYPFLYLLKPRMQSSTSSLPDINTSYIVNMRDSGLKLIIALYQGLINLLRYGHYSALVVYIGRINRRKALLHGKNAFPSRCNHSPVGNHGFPFFILSDIRQGDKVGGRI